MNLETDGIVVEPAARQPRPLHRVLAFLDMWFRRATLIVKGNDAHSGARQVGHDEADTGPRYAETPASDIIHSSTETKIMAH